jgi:hypothetical protein
LPNDGEVPENEEAGWDGGFDIVIGNPPWERIAFEDSEFFEARAPEILAAPTTALRKELIDKLQTADPELYGLYVAARRRAEGEIHLVKNSGLYPLGASGRLNTYPLFTNLTLNLINRFGRSGTVVQTGIATDAPMEAFWQALVDEGRLVSLYDFENRKAIFPIHRSYKFCLLTLRGPTPAPEDRVSCGFFLTAVEELGESTYELRLSDLSVINPRTRQPPVCRSQQDLDRLLRIQRAHPTPKSSCEAVAWVAFTSSGYSEHYLGRHELESAGAELNDDGSYAYEDSVADPLLEGKLIHQFDPCFATYESVSAGDLRQGNPRATTTEERGSGRLPTPRFWANRSIINELYARKNMPDRTWLIGIRDNARATDERTAISCILPRTGMIQPLNGVSVPSAVDALWIVATLNSYALDYVARQKVPGTHLNVTIFSQLPIPIRRDHPLESVVLNNALELSYTLDGLSRFAVELGFEGSPFGRNQERRFLLRCELDAAFFHLYGLERQDIGCVLDSFPIVKRRETDSFGEYRTRNEVLQLYDAMTSSVHAGGDYQTPFGRALIPTPDSAGREV